MFAALKEKLFGSKNSLASAQQGRSKVMARSRLHFVLVQDRTGLSPEEMTQFKKSMVEVIEKYFEIDEQGFDITYKRDSDSTTLLINSPVIVRRRGQQAEAKASEQKGEAKVDKALTDKKIAKGSENNKQGKSQEKGRVENS